MNWSFSNQIHLRPFKPISPIIKRGSFLRVIGEVFFDKRVTFPLPMDCETKKSAFHIMKAANIVHCHVKCNGRPHGLRETLGRTPAIQQRSGLLTFQAIRWIGERCPYRLKADTDQSNRNGGYASKNIYPGCDVDTVFKFHQPLIHEIPGDR